MCRAEKLLTQSINILFNVRFSKWIVLQRWYNSFSTEFLKKKRFSIINFAHHWESSRISNNSNQIEHSWNVESESCLIAMAA